MGSHKDRGSAGPSGDTSGRLPRQDRAAEAPFGNAGGASGMPGPVDPELVEDLGPELELRGDQLEDELATALAQAAEMRDAALRAQADLDNFRKRVTREREEERKRATERLIEELLPVIDNFERAIEHTTTDNDINHLLAGVTAVQAQVLGVLGKEGVSVIDPAGEPFDPNRHQAVSQQEDPAVPAGTVLAVFQKGYELAGRVLRPAMVVVSTGGPRREE